MNKVASDLRNFAPQAPAGMEERIQKKLNKKKSFWSFSWYTMNVYVVALMGAGVLALIFSNRGESNVVAQSTVPAATEVRVTPAIVADLNASTNFTSHVEKESNATQVKTTRERKIAHVETNTSALLDENSQTTVIVEPPVMEVAQTVEVQRMPEETQVPFPKKEVIKAKGRTLKLTRFTGN